MRLLQIERNPELIIPFMPTAYGSKDHFGVGGGGGFGGGYIVYNCKEKNICIFCHNTLEEDKNLYSFVPVRVI